MNWKDIKERALWTFVEAFAPIEAAGLLALSQADHPDVNALGVTTVAAFLAGASAVLSMLKGVAKHKLATRKS